MVKICRSIETIHNLRLMLDFLFSIDSLTNPTFVSNFLTIYGKIILESRIFYN